MKQSDIFVLDKCEITVDKKLYSEHEVDLHNLRKSKSVTLCPALPYISCNHLMYTPLLWFQRTRDTQNLYCMDGY